MEYYKLVRDKIPEMIRAQGQVPNVRRLNDTEYSLQLEKKLDEEVLEFHRERNAEELADILEVVFALAEDIDCTREHLMEVYQAKHDCRGGFRERFFLISKEG